MTARQHQQRFESLLHEHRRIVFKVAGLYSRTAADRDDPLLYLPSYGRTVAELDAGSKNRLSHRAQAARRMLALLREAWGLRSLDEASASGR